MCDCQEFNLINQDNEVCLIWCVGLDGECIKDVLLVDVEQMFFVDLFNGDGVSFWYGMVCIYEVNDQSVIVKSQCLVLCDILWQVCLLF